MRGRGILFHGPVNSGEAGGHRYKPEVVLALAQLQKTSALTLQHICIAAYNNG